MKRLASIIVIAVLFLAYSASMLYSAESMDRIRAVESFFYLVEARFANAYMHRLSTADLSLNKDLRGMIDRDLICLTVSSILRAEELNKGRLWVHRSFWRKIERWDRFNGRIAGDRIIRYDSVPELMGGFNAKEDVAILQRGDLEALGRGAFGEIGNLREGVILAPLSARPEYVDQIFISLILMRELKGMLFDGEPELEIATAYQFRTLKSLLESLFAMKSGFADRDVFNMIPQPGIPFQMRAFAILQNSMMPITREDLERIRLIQEAVRGN